MVYSALLLFLTPPILVSHDIDRLYVKSGDVRYLPYHFICSPLAAHKEF